MPAHMALKPSFGQVEHATEREDLSHGRVGDVFSQADADNGRPGNRGPRVRGSRESRVALVVMDRRLLATHPDSRTCPAQPRANLDICW